jgi:hypothetical protein
MRLVCFKFLTVACKDVRYFYSKICVLSLDRGHNNRNNGIARKAKCPFFAFTGKYNCAFGNLYSVMRTLKISRYLLIG